MFAIIALALTVPADRAESAEPPTAPRGARRIGIDTRFGDLVSEARKQHTSRNYTRAVALYTAALAMQPDRTNAAFLYMWRGGAQIRSPNHRAALADLETARQLRPREPLIYNDAAWLRATSPDPAVRNGRVAIQQATRACELSSWKDAHFIDTLAAAYAEAGQFDRAIAFQKQAISLADWLDRTDMKRRLRLFENGTPYRLEQATR